MSKHIGTVNAHPTGEQNHVYVSTYCGKEGISTWIGEKGRILVQLSIGSSTVGLDRVRVEKLILLLQKAIAP
jgi:hypothetical protein